MAVDQHSSDPLLSPRFIAEQDPADVISSLTVTGDGLISQNAFSLSFASYLSSSANSEQGSSTGTGENDDDDDYVAELTRQMAQHMLQDEDKHENTWGLSDSPQSTLWSPLGSDHESPTGPSREPSPPLGPTIGNSNAGFQSKQALIDNQIRAIRFHMFKQEPAIKQMEKEQMADQYQREGRDFGKCNDGQGVASNLYTLQQKQSNQQPACSDTRPVFPNAPGFRNNSCGTGVFLPRGVGTSQEPRNKQGCSTVLIPARVVHALKLHFEKMGVPPRFNAGSPPQHDAFPSGVHSFGMYSLQKRQMRTAPAMKHQETYLPQEWTY